MQLDEPFSSSGFTQLSLFTEAILSFVTSTSMHTCACLSSFEEMPHNEALVLSFFSSHLSVVPQETIPVAQCWPWKWWAEFKYCDTLNPLVWPCCVIGAGSVSLGYVNVQKQVLFIPFFKTCFTLINSKIWAWKAGEAADRHTADVSVFHVCINIFYFVLKAIFFKTLFTFSLFSSVKAVIVAVNLKLKSNAIQYKLKWSILMASKKYNLAVLSIFMPLGSFSYIKGAGHHARPAADLRPPMLCLRCLSKRSKSRQPWLQASVSAGQECVPIAHSKQRQTNLSVKLIHCKWLPHLTL